MIISASRRTDIPAFYADWFMNRVRAGFFYRVNPFNSRQVSGFSLKPEDVDAICFWTKDPRPLLPHLDELDGRGLSYYFQFTLNPYDRTFEPSVPPLVERVQAMTDLAGRIGPERVIWRYDPIILSSITPVTWHLEQAGRLAAALQGATRRLVISFCDFYARAMKRLQLVPGISGLYDIAAAENRSDLERLAGGVATIARCHGLEICTCCEAEDLSAFGIGHGACIDGRLVQRLFGGERPVRKDKCQRPGCNCSESVDVGGYDSCPFGCLYCYANGSGDLVERNRRRHDPESPLLLGRPGGEVEIRTGVTGRGRKRLSI